MSKKMLINADHPEECRAVIIENSKLDDFIVEHSSREQLKGNVYQGVITRVEPAIEAAFVDYGGKKFGFLPFKDVRRESYLATREKKAHTRIQDVLVKGQKMLVQVVKEGRDAKGPTLTNYITIPGRFLVLMCGTDSSGISRKIEDEAERKKLRGIITDIQLPENMGIIIRTAGLGRTKAELMKDVHMLMKIWDTICKKMKTSGTPPFLVYQVPDMVVRTVRDHFTNDTSEILVDNPQAHKTLKDFFKLVMPRMQNRVKLYQDPKPLFSKFNVEDQIESIYQRKVDLPAGGSIVIDVGEAMASIDVNSGKTTSASQLEETAVKTNLEAADEIARQLMLRDLGGLIVIDFIDMFQKKNKSLVEKQIKQACKKDKARINISKISKFGLVEMSRQRMSPSIREGSFDRCGFCGGTGHVKSQSALAISVLRKIQESLATGKVKVLGVDLSTDVMTYLLNNKIKFLVDLENKHDVKIEFNGKASLPYEEFSYQILEKRKEDEKPPPFKQRDKRDWRGTEATRERESAPADEKQSVSTATAETKSGDQESRTKKADTKSRPRRRYQRGNSTRRTSSARGRKWQRPKRRVPSNPGSGTKGSEDSSSVGTPGSDNPVLESQEIPAPATVIPDDSQTETRPPEGEVAPAVSVPEEPI